MEGLALIRDYGGMIQAIAADLGPFAFDHLDAPPVVVGTNQTNGEAMHRNRLGV